MKCFSVDVCIYSIILCFSDCHDSTCAFLIVMFIIMYALFYSTCDYFGVCEMLKYRCTHLQHFASSPSLPLFFLGGGVSSWLFCHFDIDVCIDSTCTFLIVKRILMSIMYSAASL